MRRHSDPLWILGLSLYLISLPMPAVTIGGHDLLGHTKSPEVMDGLACLVSGFFILPAWIGNPLLVIGVPLMLCGLPRAACVLFVIGLCSALLAPITLSVMKVDLARFEHLEIGYVFWLASFAMLVAAAVVRSREQASRAVRHWTRGPHIAG